MPLRSLWSPSPCTWTGSSTATRTPPSASGPSTSSRNGAVSLLCCVSGRSAVVAAGAGVLSTPSSGACGGALKPWP
eukprot:3167436-Lingulodinium_polyedra.AAC.1